jgi:Zn-dependent M28 family amino/carboxypeptidase
MKKIFYFAIVLLTVFACKPTQEQETPQDQEPNTQTQTNTPPATPKVPSFNADTAFFYIEKQVSFGPRVPNSTAHSQCADYLVATLQKLGASTQVQNFEAKSFDNKTWQGKNIIASINPDAKKRILLAAHWDSRRFSDKEKDTTLHKKPIDAADDGASSVAVILEILRAIQTAPEKPWVGIDVIFFDLEDDGTPEGTTSESESNDFWCLGSKYWSKNKHQPNYSAYFGILLDMVGAKGATFYKEPFSLEFAEGVVNEVWQTAQRLGYGNYFINQKAQISFGGIMDDHFYVNRDAKIPMIDIINYGGSFAPHHHTQNDNINIIDKNTLKAVGQTVLQVIYQQEK